MTYTILHLTYLRQREAHERQTHAQPFPDFWTWLLSPLRKATS